MEFIEFLRSIIHPQFFVAAGLGAIIGLERELSGKDPSLRTFSLISLGSCMFAMISVDISLVAAAGHQSSDPARIAAQIIPGIGFIGAGTIFKASGRVSGLTTAALMWVTAAIGMSVGMGRTEFAVEGTFIALLVTMLFRLVHKILRPIKKTPHPAEDTAGDP